MSRFLSAWLPSFLAVIALSLVTFGLNWWIAATPGGGARLGLVVGVANVVAVVVVAALSGLLDRAHRGRCTLVILLGAAACVAAAGLVFPHGPSLPVLLLAAVCYVAAEVLYSAYAAVMETTNADLAPRHWSSERVATLIQSQPQVERIVVPAVGGGLIAAGVLVALPVVGVALLALVLGTLAVSFRHLTAVSRVPPDRARGSLLGDVRGSAALIRGDPDLVFLLVLGALGNLVVFPFYTLLPAYLAGYGLSPAEHAALYGQAGLGYGLGLLAGSALMVRLGRRAARDPTARAALALAAICAVLLVATAAAVPLVLVAAMAVVGVLIVVSAATAGATWLRRTPAEIRVRVFSLRRLVIFSSIPLGTSLMGLGGAALGYPPFLRIHLGAVLTLLAVAWMVRVRRSRRIW